MEPSKVKSNRPFIMLALAVYGGMMLLFAIAFLR